MGIIGYNELTYNSENTLSSTSEKISISGTIKRSSNYTSIGDTSIISCEPIVTNWANGVKQSEPWIFNETTGFTRTFILEDLINGENPVKQGLWVNDKKIISLLINREDVSTVTIKIKNTGATKTLYSFENTNNDDKPSLYLYCSKKCAVCSGPGSFETWLPIIYAGNGNEMHLLVGVLKNNVELKNNTTTDVVFNITRSDLINSLSEVSENHYGLTGIQYASHGLSLNIIYNNKKHNCEITNIKSNNNNAFYKTYQNISYFSSGVHLEYLQNIKQLEVQETVLTLDVPAKPVTVNEYSYVASKSYENWLVTIARRETEANWYEYIIFAISTNSSSRPSYFDYYVELKEKGNNRKMNFSGTAHNIYQIKYGGNILDVTGDIHPSLPDLGGYEITWVDEEFNFPNLVN